jgi:integrase
VKIYKNSRGKWEFKTRAGVKPDGSVRWVKRSFKTKKEAEKAYMELMNEVHKGTYVTPSKLLYQDFIEQWFETKQHSINIQTKRVYRGHIDKQIKPLLGQMKLANIKPVHVQNFINELVSSGLSPATIRKIHRIVSMSFDYAVKIKELTDNPAKYVILPKNTKREMKVWSKEEVEKFLKEVKSSRYYIAFHLALTTGMRQGEILGLRWKDIDFENKTLTVRQTLAHNKKEFLNGGKTSNAVRKIDLFDDTIKELKAHRKVILAEKLKKGDKYQDFDLVVCTSNGTPTSQANIKRVMDNAIKRSNVPKIRFHDLRHTHATHLLEKGENVKVVAERLGHSKSSFTMDVYSHVTPSMQKEMVARLQQYFQFG